MFSSNLTEPVHMSCPQRACCWCRSEEHTSELQSHVNLVCRLLLDTPTSYIYTLSLHDALPILTSKSSSSSAIGRPAVRHEKVELKFITRPFGVHSFS